MWGLVVESLVGAGASMITAVVVAPAPAGL